MQMNGYRRGIITGILCGLVLINFCFGLDVLKVGDATSNLNKDPNDAIGIKIDGDPLRQGSKQILTQGTAGNGSIKVSGIGSISNDNYQTVLGVTTQKIKGIIDWSLGLVALACVIYLIYHGVMILVNFDDEKVQAESLGSIKTIAWVIAGIGGSWFIVSLGFYLATKFIS